MMLITFSWTFFAVVLTVPRTASFFAWRSVSDSSASAPY
jgi:hypothetical protein